MTADEQVVEVARAETERGELVLRSRRAEGAPEVLELRVNGVYVMDTLEHSTEVALAEAALALVDDPRDVVVGGLGLGFTAQRVLADPRVEHVTVVEIEEPLIGWMRDGTIPHGQALLADHRVRVVNADVRMALAEARGHYDLVLLDVDNGPDNLVHQENAALYDVATLGRVLEVLTPGGVAAVWSAAESAELDAAMRAAFGADAVEVRELPVRLHEREESYWLYLGRAAHSAR